MSEQQLCPVQQSDSEGANVKADRKSLEKAMPGIDLARVQNLQEGRVPTAWWEPLASGFLGILTLAVAFWVFFSSRKKAPGKIPHFEKKFPRVTIQSYWIFFLNCSHRPLS